MKYSKNVLKRLSLLYSLSLALTTQTWAQCSPTTIFNNDSIPELCEEVVANVRYFYSNNLPPHPWGPFPTGFSPAAKDYTWTMCAFPIKDNVATSIYSNVPGVAGCSDIYKVGISLSGPYIAEWANMYFENPNTGQRNLDWNVEATTLNLDDYGGHIAGDDYHYHIAPGKYYFDTLNFDSTQHSPIMGYAADGFPMYYRFGFSDPMDNSSPIVDLLSCYQLKQGNRPGDGITAPDGGYDGTYHEDYEHMSTSSCYLDDCNGRFGVTPEFPNGTYYYVMTEGFPYYPRCFYGTVVDNSFRQGQNCPPSSAATDCSPLSVKNAYLSQQLGIVLSPNPSSDGLLTINTTDVSYYTEVIDGIAVYDATGKLVWQLPRATTLIDLRHLANGIYFVEFTADDFQLTEKIILKK